MGYTAAAAIFAALWAAFATGRKSWLVTVFWAGVVLVMSLGAKRGLVMNGLCLLIAVLETILSIRAMYGVIMWNQSFKDKGVVLPAVIYIITLILVGYCLTQLQKLGYIPNVMGVGMETGFMRRLANFILTAVIALPPAYVGLLRFERFFSNKTELTLLNCHFYTGSLMGGKVFKGYYVYGVNNGVKHYFRVTKRAYFMLRLEDRLEFSLYKDLRGNLFAVKNPCPGNLELVAGRDLRMAKNIGLSAAVYIIVMVIIL